MFGPSFPAGATNFRLRTEATSSLTLSTKIAADWTFRSATTTAPVALPLMAVRFTPHLDADNRAPAAVPTPVPQTVEQTIIRAFLLK